MYITSGKATGGNNNDEYACHWQIEAAMDKTD